MNLPDSQTSSEPSDTISRGSEFTQLSLWMAASLAGMITAVLLIRAPFFEKMLKRIGRGNRASKKPTGSQSLPMLAGAIIGSTKATIESVFGPPRSAAVKDVGVVVLPQHVFWQADTWYYPLPRDGPMALAINFSDDLATNVEFFTAPQLA
jgi:hypothetical protein